MTSAWRPIESAPRDGTHVLIAAAGQKPTEAFYVEDKGRVLVSADKPYWEDYDFSSWERFADKWFEPTHWMPLPDPPA